MNNNGRMHLLMELARKTVLDFTAAIRQPSGNPTGGHEGYAQTGRSSGDRSGSMQIVGVDERIEEAHAPSSTSNGVYQKVQDFK